MIENPLDGLGKGRIGRRTVLKGMAGAAAIALLVTRRQCRGGQGSAGTRQAGRRRQAAEACRSPSGQSAGRRDAREDRHLWRPVAPRPARQLRPQRHPALHRQSWAWCAGTSTSPRCCPTSPRAGTVSDDSTDLRLPPAQGDEVVGRQALHRGRRGLLDRGLRQEHRALQVAAVATCRSAARPARSHQGRRHHGQVHLRRTLRPVPAADGHAARPAPDAVLQALCEPVPPQVQPTSSPTW